MSDAQQHRGGVESDFDLTQFYQIFFEEAAENLDLMEQMLLTLPSENFKPAPDIDTVIDRESVVGLGSLRDRMLILLDIEKLMASQGMALTSDAIN